ncbi:MAG: protein kinase, partial [Planctomycetota bacterium]
MSQSDKPDNACPSRDDLQAVVSGVIDKHLEFSIESHIATCEICLQTLENLARDKQERQWQNLAARSKDDPALFCTDQFGADKTEFLVTPPSLPGFEIHAIAGTGGMGIVYQARQRSLDRIVAIKVLHSTAPNDLERIRRFKNEADSIASINHPNVISIYEIGQHDGLPFIVLEYVHGPNLSEIIARSAPFDGFSAARLIRKVAMAVDSAHQQNLIHRDLKPANILMQVVDDFDLAHITLKDCEPKVTDFGLAKSFEHDDKTGTSILVGTPGYMAPEQIVCSEDWATPAVDVYALGVILFELLTGRMPFEANSTFDLFKKIETEEPASIRSFNRKVPKDLDAICLKCLEKSPLQRYESAKLLADDLDRFMRKIPVNAREKGPLLRLKKWGFRKKWQIAVGIVLTAAAVFLGMYLFNVHQQRHAAIRNFNNEITIANELFEQAIHSNRSDLAIWERAQKAIGRAEQINTDFPDEVRKSKLARLADSIAIHFEARRLAKTIEDLRFANQSQVLDVDFKSAVSQAFEDFGLSLIEPNVSQEISRILKLDAISREGVLNSIYSVLLSRTDIARTRLEQLVNQLDASQWRRDLYQAIIAMDKSTAVQLIQHPDLSIDGDSLATFTATLLTRVRLDFPDIVRFLKTCHQRYQSSFWLNYWLAIFVRGAEPPKNAIPYARATIAQRDTAATRMALGSIYMDMRNWGDAAREYENIVANHPEYGPVYVKLANCYRQLKNYDSAIQYYNLSLIHEPNSHDIRGNLLDCYKELERSDEATELAHQCIARTSVDHETFYSKARAYLLLGNLDKAIEN